MAVPKVPREVQAVFSKIAEPRRTEALEIYRFVAEAVPGLAPWTVNGLIGFGSFHYKGKTREGEWLKVGIGCNKSSFSVYSCAWNEKGMLAEQYADQLGKVSVGKSCVRFKKWSDVNKPALRRLLEESVKSRFAFE